MKNSVQSELTAVQMEHNVYLQKLDHNNKESVLAFYKICGQMRHTARFDNVTNMVGLNNFFHIVTVWKI